MEGVNLIFCAHCGIGINLTRGDVVYHCRGCEKEVCSGCYLPDYLSCVPCEWEFQQIKAEYEKWAKTIILETYGHIQMGTPGEKKPAHVKLTNAELQLVYDDKSPLEINPLYINSIVLNTENIFAELQITYLKKKRMYRISIFKEDLEVLSFLHDNLQRIIKRLIWVHGLLYEGK